MSFHLQGQFESMEASMISRLKWIHRIAFSQKKTYTCRKWLVSCDSYNCSHTMRMGYFFLLIFFLADFFATKMNAGKLRSHEENRRVCCAGCGKKDTKCFNITPTIEALLKEEVYDGYNSSDCYFPSGICGVCRNNLFIARKGSVVPAAVRDRWNSMDYSKFRPPSRSTPCACQICQVVRFKWEKVEEGIKPEIPRIIETTNEAEAC